MEDKPLNIFGRIFDEFKAGNPLFILMALFLIVLLSVFWVWQLINSPVTILPTKFSHPTAAARIKTLTAQASAQSRVNPPARVAVSTPLPVRQTVPHAAFLQAVPIAGTD